MAFLDTIKSFIPSFRSNSIYSTIGYRELSDNTVNTFNISGYTSSTIKTCARILANSTASNPLVIYEEYEYGTELKTKHKRVLKKDPRYKMLHYAPNGYTTAYTFWHTMEMTKQETGNAYAIIHRFNKDKKVKSWLDTKSVILEFAPPEHLENGKPYFEDKKNLKYKFKTDDGEQTYDSSEIIHFKRDSKNTLIGENPYDVLYDELRRTYLANKTITNFYEKDGKGKTFIKVKITDGDPKRFEARLDKFREESIGYSKDEKGNIIVGNQNKIKPFAALPSDAEFETLPNDQNDALYLATIQTCDLKIAAYYQIPPHYLNIIQAQKNSDVENLQIDFKTAAMQHILRSNRQELELKLLTEEERDKGMSIEYNTMATVELDHKTRLEGYKILRDVAGLQFNEVRSEEALPPIEGGDKTYLFNQVTPLENLNVDSSVN